MWPRDLPINDALPELLAELRAHGKAVLQAPPGAGKTTVVPLAMLEAGLFEGRLLMLEPRRLAARAAAERMAHTLGENVGGRVGYRMRGASKRSAETRIDFVTEAILTRMIQSDPELRGVGAVIFDEFHERSLQADLGLALCLEIVGALREDLLLLVMSATLDAAPVARILGNAPLVTAPGRSFPVDTVWRARPLGRDTRLETAVAEQVSDAIAQTDGGVLVFLPGEAEIRRTHKALTPRLAAGCEIRPLYGAMPFSAQRAAIQPMQAGRKIVLATSIAETSLTIEDIRVVVDAGLARRARYDPGSGMSRLVTEKVSRAEADQRAGRAGRVAPGVTFRMWTRAEEGGLAAFPPAEIEAADLTGLALELAAWGADPADLAFLTPPPESHFTVARAVLRLLGALDAQDRITAHGKDLAALPLHPRLGHMLVTAGKPAARLAALLSDRDPLGRGSPADLLLRLDAIDNLRRFSQTRPYSAHRATIERIRVEATRLEKIAPAPARPGLGPAEMAALAYPDRIGLRRKGDDPRFVLSGGKGAQLAADDTLAAARLIVATDLDGDPREARIRQAAQLSEAELRLLYSDQIGWHQVCAWSRRERRVVARRQERFAALVLDDRVWKDVPRDAVARAMLDGVRDLGLVWTDPARLFAARAALVPGLPDMSEAALMKRLEEWLLPYLDRVSNAEEWKRFDILPALRAQLDWDQQAELDRVAPGHFTTPLGRRIVIDYSGEHPEIRLRLQELFGQTRHPCIGDTPLRVTLLSPAGRPVQTTRDIPGFWASSYADVRKDMRGRYPKHPWPEDPTKVDPTLRTKRRGA